MNEKKYSTVLHTARVCSHLHGGSGITLGRNFYVTFAWLTVILVQHVHTYIHTYIHTCIHAYMHTCIHAYILVCT